IARLQLKAPGIVGRDGPRHCVVRGADSVPMSLTCQPGSSEWSPGPPYVQGRPEPGFAKPPQLQARAVERGERTGQLLASSGYGVDVVVAHGFEVRAVGPNAIAWNEVGDREW